MSFNVIFIRKIYRLLLLPFSNHTRKKNGENEIVRNFIALRLLRSVFVRVESVELIVVFHV